MVETIKGETKREGQRKAKRHGACRNQKKGELVPLVVGSYLTHGHSNVACKSWNLIVMEGLKQASHANAIFFFIVKVKAH
jgi:hypothetical protein